MLAGSWAHLAFLLVLIKPQKSYFLLILLWGFQFLLWVIIERESFKLSCLISKHPYCEMDAPNLRIQRICLQMTLRKLSQAFGFKLDAYASLQATNRKALHSFRMGNWFHRKGTLILKKMRHMFIQVVAVAWTALRLLLKTACASFFIKQDISVLLKIMSFSS